MQIIYLAYLLFVAIVIFFSLPYLKNKAFMLLMLLWLLLYPIMVHPDYMINLDFLGFDLQPNRILFLILTPVLFLSAVTSKHNKWSERKRNNIGLHWFEKWLILFVIVAIIASIINVQHVGSRQIIANITQMATFLLVYFSAKRFISRDDFLLLSRVIIVFAILSSVIGIYQFFVDPQFFRIGKSLGAFGSFTRANGFFSSEYIQGTFLTIAFLICMSTISNKLLKLLILGLISFGVLLTMHRLSWAVFIFMVMVIWVLSIKGSTLKIAIILLMGTALMITILLIPITGVLSQRGMERFLEERVLVDTLTGRLILNEFALDLIIRYPEGIGDIWTDLYNQEALKFPKHIPFLEYGALSIHNGFLSAGVKYGVIGLLTFTTFYISAIIFFIRNKINQNIMWYLPILCILTFFLFNTTQDYSFLGSQINIFWALLLGCFTAIVNTGFEFDTNRIYSVEQELSKT